MPAVQGIPTRLHLRGELLRLLAAALHDAKGCLLQLGRPARASRKAADRVKTDVRDSATLAREREDAQCDMEVATRCEGIPPLSRQNVGRLGRIEEQLLFA